MKLCTKFHRNRPSFLEDITKNDLVSFFPDTLYNHLQLVHDCYHLVTIS